MTDQNLAAVRGCYSVNGHPLFRISGSTIFARQESRGFKGVREKDGDVLLLDSPVKLAWGTEPSLVTAGTASKISISYSEPVRLRLWDKNDREVAAVKSPCTKAYSRSAV
jgi:hypothetical protein